MFGGKIVPIRKLTSEMWALDLTTRTWSRVNAGQGPGPRYFHSMDVWEDKLVCFGGMSDADSLCVHNDVWFFDCRARRWLPQPGPESPIGLGMDGSETFQLPNPEFIPQARYAHLSAVSRGQLIVCGGQRSDNSWIYEINTFDLKRQAWVSKTEQPESHGMHSKGAYRSVAVSSTLRVVVPVPEAQLMIGSPALPYTVEEEGGGGDIWCYSNYDFAKVRRELEVVSPLDGAEAPEIESDKFEAPPDFTIHDMSIKMTGSSQPPGLRFPAGGIVGHHFILCGLYLASTSAAFSIWTLDLHTLQWKHLEPPVLSSGSWNRAVICPETAKLIVFGNANHDLAADYGKRAVNFDQYAIIELEAYGIYQPPRRVLSDQTQGIGLSMLDEKLVSDFELIAEDGRKVRCSRKVLADRWPWFAEQQSAIMTKAAEAVQDTALDINEALLGSLSPARVTPTSLHLPEPLPVCVALIQYFYTLSLSTPLQTRSPVLTALLFLSKQYKIERLNKLVTHALHMRLRPSSSVGVYEVATLAGEYNLQARALQMIHQAKSASSSRQNNRRRPGSVMSNEGAGGSHQSHSNTPPAAHGSLPDSGAGDSTQHNGNVPGSQLQNLKLGASSIDVSTRRLRSGSFTAPYDQMKATVTSSPSKATQRARPVTTQFDAEELADDLLNALDISNAPAVEMEPWLKRRRPASIMSVSTTRTNVSSASSRPPMLPPPEKPLPGRPAHAPPHLSLPSTPRASSPTNSEATSAYPATPSESVRDSLSSMGSDDRRHSICGSLVSNSKSSTLPALPEDGLQFRPSEEEEEEDEVLVTSNEAEPTLASQVVSYTLNTKLARSSSMSSLKEPVVRLYEKRATTEVVPERSSGGIQRSPPIGSGGFGGSLGPAIGARVASIGSASSHSEGRVRTWTRRESSQFLAQAPRSETEDEEAEKLAKFQALMIEQQRRVGVDSMESIKNARKAFGRAGADRRTKFNLFGKKVSQAIMS